MSLYVCRGRLSPFKKIMFSKPIFLAYCCRLKCTKDEMGERMIVLMLVQIL